MANLKFMQPKTPKPRGQKPARSQSQLQEQRTASLVGGSLQPGSGAFVARKGDVKAEHYLIECKTTGKGSISLTREWLEKISREAIAAGKEPAMVLGLETMPPELDSQWLVVPARLFPMFKLAS